MTNSKVVFQTTSRSSWSKRAMALGMALVAVRRRCRARRSPTPDISDTAVAAPSSTRAMATTRAAVEVVEAAIATAALSSGARVRPVMDSRCSATTAATTDSGPTTRVSRLEPPAPTQQPIKDKAKAASTATPCIGRFQTSRPGAIAPVTAA